MCISRFPVVLPTSQVLSVVLSSSLQQQDKPSSQQTSPVNLPSAVFAPFKFHAANYKKPTNCPLPVDQTTSLPTNHIAMAPKENNSSNKAGNGSSTNNSSNVPQYTAEEKAYVKKEFGSEFHMLRDHGMSIYKDEHREEGRLIARAFKENDENERETDSKQ